jgi:uncharacterized protein (DUF427 family)
MRVTEEIRRLRNQWTFRGETRPEFAHVPAAGQESVWDYPRPPQISADARRIIVSYADRIIAESTRSVRVLETAGPPTFYVPREDVQMPWLSENDTRSLCEWKGTAVGFDLVGGPPDVAWSYLQTFPEFDAIATWVAFYPAVIDCSVDGETVRPQPGGYYGGWITDEIVGPFKGERIAEGL